MNISVTPKIVPVYYALLKACVQIRLNSNFNAIIFTFHVNILLILVNGIMQKHMLLDGPNDIQTDHIAREYPDLCTWQWALNR